MLGDDWQGDPSFYFHEGEIPTRPRRSDRSLLGDGRLATEADLGPMLAAPASPQDRGLVLPMVTPLVEAPGDSTTLRPLLHRSLHLAPDVRDRHVLAVGQTGSGKTARLILPALASDLEDPGRAIIALDAKGGVFQEVLGRLARRVRPWSAVHRLNPAHPGRSTIRWNPVRSIKTRSEALAVAHAVCTNADSGLGGGVNNEAFWLFSSMNLLADLLLALALDPKEDASLTRAKALVDGFPVEMAEFAEAHPRGYPAIQRVLEGHSQNPSTSIVADLAMRLLLFDDEGVAAVTGGPDELDLAELIGGAGVLVIEVFEEDASRLLPLTNLLLGRLLDDLIRQATSRPDGRLARPTTLTLDELGSACGKIHRFETRIATLRSRGVSIIAAVQTLGQLEQVYGKSAESIVANFGTKVFFGGGLGLADARHASELSGTMTVDLGPEPTDEGGPWVASAALVSRPVLLPDEIARPRVHPLLGPPATIITPDLPPFQAYLTPSYELPGLAAALAPHRSEKASPQEGRSMG